MQKVLVAAALVTVLTVPALAGEADERDAHPREAAVGEILTPRPGAAIRETLGSTSPQAPSSGRVNDDRMIVEERPPSVTPQNCPAGATQAECAR